VSDERLLEAMAAGDAEAAAVFVRRYQPRVHGLALAIVGSTAVAEEVAQETFLRVWRHAPAYDNRRGKVASWVLTIARNVAIDAMRNGHEHPIDPQELTGTLLLREEALPQPSPYELRKVLDDALAALPLEQRRVIVLSVVYGLTAREAADLEGLPLGTVKTRIRRGLARLRRALL
jgi:RNA polymerase sigma factor (sigma-70 family)